MRLIAPWGAGAPSAEFLRHLIFGVGALLTLLAASFRTWAAAYLQSNTVQDPKMHLDAIVADGPYRHLRNPLYLGAILLAFGMALLTSWPGFLIITIGLTLFILRLTGLEESKLEAMQGESYREFCRRVPRLWPSLKARLPDGGVKPQWGQAILGELHMWGFFAGMAAFAITLRPACGVVDCRDGGPYLRGDEVSCCPHGEESFLRRPLDEA